MARDPLATVRTIRLRAVDRLRRDLSACMAAEAELAARVLTLGQGVLRDNSVHDSVKEAHRFQEMFAVRRAMDRADREAAAVELAAAQTRCAEVRAALVEARVAAEAVSAVIAERSIQTTAALGRREQHELEEAARPRGPRGAPAG